MKARILFFLVCICGTLTLHAQKFHFGLKAAPGIAWFRSDTKGLDSDGPKLGFTYGLITEFAFTEAENYAFASGIDVVYRGGKTTMDDSSGSINSKINLQYIEVPLTFKMKTNEIGAMKYFGQFGLTPGYNIRTRGETEAGNVTKKDIDLEYKITKFNLSLYIALGGEYNLSGNTSFLVSVNFSSGFMDVADDKDLKLFSNMVSINLGVLF